MFTIDHQKMHDMASKPSRPATAADLYREAHAFFVGGGLPVRETLETMFDSRCEEATDLFIVSFGAATLRQGVDMVMALKKNFSIRLMVHLEQAVPGDVFPQIYAAGADLMGIAGGEPEWHQAAVAAFPRWAVASTLFLDGTPSDVQVQQIDDLLHAGIVPLPRLCPQQSSGAEKEACTVLQYLVKSWRRHKVAVRPFAPVIVHGSPLVPSRKPGPLRTLLDRFHERQQLVTSDLLRHLRVTAPADSLDSASL